MIELRSVSKRYRVGRRTHTVFEGLSFRVPDRASLGVFGPNGVGKSTLLRLLAGIEAPDEGEIRVDGTVSWPVGISGAMQGSLTGRQNAALIARIHGLADQQIAQCVQGIAAFADVGDHFDAPVRTYSSGMRARLNFAASVVFDFDVWLIDEITAVGDARFRARCVKVMDIKRRESQFVVVSHNLGELVRTCDCGIVLGKQPRFYDDVLEARRQYFLETGG